MYFESFAVGQLQQARIENACYVIIGADSDYRVNLVSGDECFLVKYDGSSTQDTFLGMDPDLQTINFDKIGEINIHSLVFLGRID